jgi:hypothetical protein
MDGTLAEFAASEAPLPERLRVARELAAAASALAARGRAHGALVPGAVVVLADATVALRAASAAAPLDRAGFDAPEVARGGRPSPRADAFSVGALAWLALAGRPPFGADDPLEAVRRALHEEAEPVRLHAPGVPVEVEAAIAALLEKRPRHRARPEQLVSAIDAVIARDRARRAPRLAPLSRALPGGEGRIAVPSQRPPEAARAVAAALPIPLPSQPAPPPRPRAPVVAPLVRRHLPTLLRVARRCASALAALLVLLARACGASVRALLPAAARAVRATAALPPLPRTALAILPLFALSFAMLPRTDAALARDVAGLLERGDTARARAVVDEAARRRPADPVVEKLRGDVACARGAPGECLRRYRVAIAAREDLKADPALRRNARRLLDRGQSCGTRRAAAQLLGELRDPEALPALEDARRSGGLFSLFCTGDAFDRAIAATRASAR